MRYAPNNIESVRLEIGKSINQKQKSELGQFMTPLSIARYMSSLFSKIDSSSCRILDAGAGIGILSTSLIDRYIQNDRPYNDIELHAFEIDSDIYSELSNTLTEYKINKSILIKTHHCDFIERAVNELIPNNQRYHYAILNPPYKKINSNSDHRKLLRKVGIETVNLYSAFVALSLLLLEQNGQLVAIIPRSFCNGPYYKPFREIILRNASIKHIHLFEARNKAFKDDGVLQENIIIHLERTKNQNNVIISTSTDESFSDYNKNEYPFSRIVNNDDAGKFIHIPTTHEKNNLELSSKINFSLADLDIQVSTGPVVDFRVREFLRDMPLENTVPLLYPGHFSNMSLIWPRVDLNKSNAIIQHSSIDKWLYPNGFYTVIKRFSSKEEKRRISASVINPISLPYQKIGFENHLNVLHNKRHGISENLAWGLAIFLNSTLVDDYFRQFNGHTQVNATDLRTMKYPNHETLNKLGEWGKTQDMLDQLKIDNKIEEIL